MWKKALYLSLAVSICGSPAVALEIPQQPASDFASEATAYSSNRLNQILEAHGVSLAPESVSSLPAGYARLAAGEMVYSDLATAYSPEQYHRILAGYGLELTPENAGRIVVRPYVQVAAGELFLTDSPAVAYGKREWQNILGAYSQVAVAEASGHEFTGRFEEPENSVNSANDAADEAIADEACGQPPQGAKLSERGCWEYASDVLFGFDRADLRPEYRAELEQIKNVFDLNPGLKIMVVGHTCSLGRTGYNQRLSEQRAKAVVDYLVEVVGIDSASVTWNGFGEKRPAYSNETGEGRAKNRRVELKRWE